MRERTAVIGTWIMTAIAKANAAAAALKGVTRVTAVSANSGLYELKNETLGGIAPPLTFTPGRPTFVRCYFTDELKDGRFVPLNDSRPSCLSQADAAAVVASAHP